MDSHSSSMQRRAVAWRLAVGHILLCGGGWWPPQLMNLVRLAGLVGGLAALQLGGVEPRRGDDQPVVGWTPQLRGSCRGLEERCGLAGQWANTCSCMCARCGLALWAV